MLCSTRLSMTVTVVHNHDYFSFQLAMNVFVCDDAFATVMFCLVVRSGPRERARYSQ